MSKWHNLIVYAVIFNVLISVGFVLASNYMFDYLNTEISDIGYTSQGLYSIPFIVISGFQVSISHDIYENGQVVNLGALPTVVPNYPFILFWISILKNLILIALAIVLRNKELKPKL